MVDGLHLDPRVGSSNPSRADSFYLSLLMAHIVKLYSIYPSN